MSYYHVVFTLPAAISDIAYTNKAAVYGALFKAVSQTLLTIGADPKHLGANHAGTSIPITCWSDIELSTTPGKHQDADNAHAGLIEI